MSAVALNADSDQYQLHDVIRAAQQGDRTAMDQLCVRFERQVLAIAFKRLGNWDEAQELSQDVFVQAFRRLDQLQTPEAFPGWIRQIVVRMAINRATRRRRLANIDQEILEATVVSHADPSKAAMSAETKQQVHQGLRSLRDLDRQTLVAFYFEEQSLVEMSKTFDAPVGTIKRRLHTARKRLAQACSGLVGPDAI